MTFKTVSKTSLAVENKVWDNNKPQKKEFADCNKWLNNSNEVENATNSEATSKRVKFKSEPIREELSPAKMQEHRFPSRVRACSATGGQMQFAELKGLKDCGVKVESIFTPDVCVGW